MIPFPIVDTHVHLWDPERLHYAWLSGEFNKKHLPDDYRKACGAVQVDKIVFLQCECDPVQHFEEARWVSGLAKEEPRLQGIVPWAPLERGEAARASLETLAQDPLVKGIRRIIQFEGDPEFCLRADFIRGVQLCAEFGLHFEICVDHRQMATCVAMVRQCPNVTFVIDHIGKPDIKNRITEPWASQMRALADFPNVWCKISGLVVEADHERWTLTDLRPYLGLVIEAFGWDRVMFGGDWPVVLQVARLDRWIETLYEAVRQESESRRRKLFRENAIAFYRLPA